MQLLSSSKTTLWLPSDLYCTFYISSKIKAIGDPLNVILLGFSQCSTLRYVFVFHFYDRHSLAWPTSVPCQAVISIAQLLIRRSLPKLCACEYKIRFYCS